MTLRPLGKVKNLVESLGMGISHVHEDLVFLEHNAFLLQFGQDGTSLIIHMNAEANKEDLSGSLEQLENAAPQHELHISQGDLYTIAPSEKDTIIIEFHE